jgi:hypothetical protein
MLSEDLLLPLITGTSFVAQNPWPFALHHPLSGPVTKGLAKKVPRGWIYNTISIKRIFLVPGQIRQICSTKL